MVFLLADKSGPTLSWFVLALFSHQFLNGGKFVVMDLGANDVLQVASQHDAEMKRPVPLQVVASATAGSYRLYTGRDYVEFRRAQ